MFTLIFTLFTSAFANAIVMEPAYQAAESLGYQVVGEIEFQNNSSAIPAPVIKKQMREIGEMCPRTQSADPNISSYARFVILAWSDKDYPTRERGFHSAKQQWLAKKRGEAVAERIRSEVKGNLNFELVNMAHRKAHRVEAVEPGNPLTVQLNVKKAVEIAGAAPSDQLGVGLFAEYSQAAKALIWVDCREGLQRQKGTIPSLVRLAELGRAPTGL